MANPSCINAGIKGAKEVSSIFFKKIAERDLIVLPQPMTDVFGNLQYCEK
jgi:hypothetical protein